MKEITIKYQVSDDQDFESFMDNVSGTVKIDHGGYINTYEMTYTEINMGVLKCIDHETIWPLDKLQAMIDSSLNDTFNEPLDDTWNTDVT